MILFFIKLFIYTSIVVLGLSSCKVDSSSRVVVVDSGISLTAPELAGAIDADSLFAEVTISYTVSLQLIENTVTAAYNEVTGLWKVELDVLPDTEFTLDITWYDMLDSQGRRADLVKSSTSARSGNVDSSIRLNVEFSDFDDAQFDADSDGMSNLEERNNGTDPFESTVAIDTDAIVTEATVRIMSIHERETSQVRYLAASPTRDSRWIEQPLSPDYDSFCDRGSSVGTLDFTTNLEDACTLTEDCFLQLDQGSMGLEDGVLYSIRGPQKLNAPVSLQYDLHVTDSESNTKIYPHVFCLTAANKAPVAVADKFTVISRVPFVVSANEIGVNLLSNDSDDEYFGNKPLQIDTDPVTSPIFGVSFNLESDGGFSYFFDIFTNLTTGFVTDRFTYSVSDGESSSTAEVTLHIINEDRPPEVVSSIPHQSFTVGVDVYASLLEYFSDFEASIFFYEILTGDMPPSGELVLENTGVFSGVPQPGDEGTYSIEITVSDRQSSVNSVVSFDVVENQAPIASEIPDVFRIEGNDLLQKHMSRYFSDPEGKTLNYSLTSEPASNITINPVSGYISGRFTEPGNYELTVSATDRINDVVTRSFNVTVQ